MAQGEKRAAFWADTTYSWSGIQQHIYWSSSQALVLRCKGLNTLINVQAAAKFLKKTQNCLTHLSNSCKAQKQTLSSSPQSWGPTFWVPARPHKNHWLNHWLNLPLQQPPNVHHPTTGTGEHKTLVLQTQTSSEWQKKGGSSCQSLLSPGGLRPWGNPGQEEKEEERKVQHAP